MTRYFITATGTDIGKTFITAALTWQWRQQGKNVRALKPIISGYDEQHPEPSDSAQLLAAQGLTLGDIDTISPWRFAAPLSPDMAAAAEQRTLAPEALYDFCNKPNEADITLIEGVGGVMSPITQTLTVLDWMEQLNLPVILVTGSYVGTISHTLTALLALQSRSLHVARIFVSETTASAASLTQTCQSLRHHIGNSIDIFPVHRLNSQPDIWKHADTLTKGLL